MAGKLTLAVRLALGFGALLLLLMVAVAVGLDRFASVNAMVERVVARDWENTVRANRVIDLMNAQTRDTFRLFHVAERAPIGARIAERVHAISALLDELDAHLDDHQSRAVLARIRAQRAAYVASFSLVSSLLERGQPGAASRLMDAETVPALDALIDTIAELITLQGQLLADTGADSLAAFVTARQLQAGLLGGALVVALLLSIWIARAVLRPLGGEPDDVKAVVDRIAGGDLHAAIGVRRGDETSLLAAMRRMQTKLRELIDARDAAECALRASQQRFQGLVETQHDWIWEVDTDWRYTYVSRQVRGVLGYAPEEVLGRTVFDLMPPEEARRLRPVVERVGIAQQPIVAVENINLHRDGHRVVLETSGRPYYDEHGKLCGYRGLDREITGRKEAEASRLQEAVKLRDALIREVHHRIKNNLQTVVGLLRRIGGRHPGARAAIESAVAQVQAVAIVHGMYGRVAHHRIMLCQLLPVVARSVSDLTGVPVAPTGPGDGEGQLLLNESETVAVALIINELITNAVKHATLDEGVAPTRVMLNRVGGRGRILIVNRGVLPVGFDFDTGQGLGTGLGLVRALMPVPGMSIAFRQTGEYVEVEILIGVPVLSAAPAVAGADGGATASVAAPESGTGYT